MCAQWKNTPEDKSKSWSLPLPLLPNPTLSPSPPQEENTTTKKAVCLLPCALFSISIYNFQEIIRFYQVFKYKYLLLFWSSCYTTLLLRKTSNRTVDLEQAAPTPPVKNLSSSEKNKVTLIFYILAVLWLSLPMTPQKLIMYSKQNSSFHFVLSVSRDSLITNARYIPKA